MKNPRSLMYEMDGMRIVCVGEFNVGRQQCFGTHSLLNSLDEMTHETGGDEIVVQSEMQIF